ncbi:MAG: hypothetical protein R2706_05495 [Acidimicrobiales bacterium]
MHKDKRRAVVEDVFELGDREPPIEQDADGAEPPARKLEIEELNPVVGQNTDAVAASDPDRCQIRRRGVNPTVKFCVAEGPSAAEVTNRLRCRSMRRMMMDPVIDRNGPVSRWS